MRSPVFLSETMGGSKRAVIPMIDGVRQVDHCSVIIGLLEPWAGAHIPLVTGGGRQIPGRSDGPIAS